MRLDLAAVTVPLSADYFSAVVSASGHLDKRATYSDAYVGVPRASRGRQGSPSTSSIHAEVYVACWHTRYFCWYEISPFSRSGPELQGDV